MSDSGSVGPVDGSDGNVLRAALSTEEPTGHEEDPPALADYDPLPEEQPDERIPALDAADPAENPSPS